MAGNNDVGALVVTLEAQTAAFTAGMAQATKELEKFGGASKAVESQFTGIQGAMVKFNVATTALSNGMALVSNAFNSIAGFAKTREAMLSLEGSFKAVLGSGERAADMMMRVQETSNSLGLPLEQTADAMRRMSIGMKSLGSSNEEIQKVTENFLKLGATGGSIEEASGAVFQFSQALGSGSLRGDEMISLLERAPTVANRIAESLGITIGQLRKMGGEGKVTSQILVDALKDSDGKISESFGNLPRRISQSLNVINNQFTQFKVEFAKAFQINEKITVALEQVGQVATYVFGNLIAFSKDVAASMDDIIKVAELLAIVFAGPLLEAVLMYTRAMLAAALANPFTAIVAIAGVVVLNWTAVKNLFVDIGIAAIDAGIAVKKAFGFDTSGLEVLKSDLLLTKLQMNDIAGATKKTGEGFTENFANPAKNAAKTGRDAWKSFVEGLQNFKEDLGMVNQKLAYMYKLLSTETNPQMITHLQEEIDKLKAAGDPFEQWRQGIEKAQDGVPQLTEKIAYMQMLMLDTTDPVILKKYKEDLEQLQDTLGKGTDKFYDLTKKINGSAKAAEDVATQLQMIDEALAEGKLNATQAEKLKAEVEGVNLELKKMSEGITDAIDRNASNAVNNFIDTLGQAEFSFSKFTESVLKDIAKMIVQLTIMKPLMDSIKNSLPGATAGSGGGGFGSWLGGLFGGASGASMSDVSTSPQVFKFATGGVFGATQGRIGVMGESGPEAIMPLKRGGDGKLGVTAAPTTVNVYNNADTTVTTAETTNQDGSKQIDIMIEKKVKEMFGSGSMDKSMRTSYGLTRAAQ